MSTQSLTDWMSHYQTPPIVAPLPTQRGTWMLFAGESRWRRCSLPADRIQLSEGDRVCVVE